jgi:hypothetical protein
MQYFWIVHIKWNSQEFETLNLHNHGIFDDFTSNSRLTDLLKMNKGSIIKKRWRAGSKRARRSSTKLDPDGTNMGQPDRRPIAHAQGETRLHAVRPPSTIKQRRGRGLATEAERGLTGGSRKRGRQRRGVWWGLEVVRGLGLVTSYQ